MGIGRLIPRVEFDDTVEWRTAVGMRPLVWSFKKKRHYAAPLDFKWRARSSQIKRLFRRMDHDADQKKGRKMGKKEGEGEGKKERKKAKQHLNIRSATLSRLPAAS